MTNKVRAIILAAGKGLRLRPYTRSIPKSMVVLGGRSLLDQQITVMKELDIQEIIVVTGYCEEHIKAFWPRTISNPNYDCSNMVYSLMCAKELLNGDIDVLVTYGDIVYDPFVLEAILQCDSPLCTTVDRCWQRLWEIRSHNPIDDAESLKMDNKNDIIELGKKPNVLSEIEAQYMGITKFSASYAPKIVRIFEQMDPVGLYDEKDLPNIYMTSFLQYLIDNGIPLKAVIVNGGWLEVDTAEELDMYNRMHQNGTLSEFYRGPKSVRLK